MSKIKTKEINKGTIKSIDKSAVALEKTKDVLVDVKKKSENAYNGYDNVNDYLSQRRKLRRTDHLFGGRPKNAFIHRRSQAQPTDPFSQ